MKVLFTAVNAKYVHTNIAVRYLKGYVKKHGIDAEFAELLDTLSEDELKERAAEDVEDSDAMCYYSEA